MASQYNWISISVTFEYLEDSVSSVVAACWASCRHLREDLLKQVNTELQKSKSDEIKAWVWISSLEPERLKLTWEIFLNR